METWQSVSKRLQFFCSRFITTETITVTGTVQLPKSFNSSVVDSGYNLPLVLSGVGAIGLQFFCSRFAGVFVPPLVPGGGVLQFFCFRFNCL